MAEGGGLRGHVVWVGAVLVAVVVATWPLIPSLGSVAVGHAYGDMADHYWGTWWFGRELLSGQLPLRTDVSHFPETLSLWYVDPVGALLALPARFLGFPADWNLLLLLQVTLGALAGYAIGYDASGDKAGGLVSATVVGTSPYVLGLLHSGLTEYLGLALPALYVASLLRTVGADPRGRGPTPRGGVVTAVLLGLAGWEALYYLFFGALFALATVPGAGWRERVRTVAGILVGAALVATPAAVASLGALGAGGAVTATNAPGWASLLPATDVMTFFRPGAWYFPDTPADGNPGILHVNYLGWVALLLALVAARGRFGWAGLGYGVFALGPRLAFAKQVVTIAGASVLLPFGLLCFPGSPFAWIHQPYRMVAFLIPWLGMAAARGVTRLPSAVRPLLAVAVLLETILVSPAPWPLATRPVTPPAVYASLEAGPVLDWPPDASTWNRDYLVWATSHGQAVPYGVNVFLGEKLRKDPLVDSLLRARDNLEKTAKNRDVPFQGRVLLRPTGTRSGLAELGFAHVVVHKAALSDREWGRTRGLLLGAFGEPVSEDADVAVWTPK